MSHSTLHTERLGERIAKLAHPGDIVALWGELGAGKTVLARGIAEGLGLDPSDVTSPTFVILREHAGGRLPLFHLDLYRLRAGDLGSTGWEECSRVAGHGHRVADRAGDDLPADRLDVGSTHRRYEAPRRHRRDRTGLPARLG